MFEWDGGKAEANASKHGLSFQSAVAVFDDLRRIESYDSEHSTKEEIRYITTGLTGQGLITVVYTCRGETIR